jgi:hypothetical protein
MCISGTHAHLIIVAILVLDTVHRVKLKTHSLSRGWISRRLQLERVKGQNVLNWVL